MRKYLASLALGFCISAASPVMAASVPSDESAAAVSVAVQRVRVPMPRLRDEAAMVLVGTALIGLAAAVRRSRFA